MSEPKVEVLFRAYVLSPLSNGIQRVLGRGHESCRSVAPPILRGARNRQRPKTLLPAVVAILVTASPAAGFLIPGIERPATPEPTPVPTPVVGARLLAVPEEAAPAEAEAAPPEAAVAAPPSQAIAPLKWVNGWAVNASYLYSKQDLRVSGAGFSIGGESKVETYSARLEHIVTPWLGVYGLVGHHYGDSQVPGSPKVSLDGWLAGAGFNAAIAPPMWVRQVRPFGIGLAYAPFAQLDFNYTYNDFDDVKNGLDAFNVVARFGVLTRTDRYSVDVYAGPAFQDVTEKQVVQTAAGDVTLSVKPESQWNGVIGMIFGLMPNPNVVVPPASLIVEGGVGDRKQILVSLRLTWL